MTPWNCYYTPTAWVTAPLRRNIIIMCLCRLRPASISLWCCFRSSSSSDRRNNQNDVGKYHNFYSHIYEASKLNAGSGPSIDHAATPKFGRDIFNFYCKVHYRSYSHRIDRKESSIPMTFCQFEVFWVSKKLWLVPIGVFSFPQILPGHFSVPTQNTSTTIKPISTRQTLKQLKANSQNFSLTPIRLRHLK